MHVARPPYGLYCYCGSYVWTGRDSDPLPLLCHSSALPIELPAHDQRTDCGKFIINVRGEIIYAADSFIFGLLRRLPNTSRINAGFIKLMPGNLGDAMPIFFELIRVLIRPALNSHPKPLFIYRVALSHRFQKDVNNGVVGISERNMPFILRSLAPI